jgi:hypothetical protein
LGLKTQGRVNRRLKLTKKRRRVWIKLLIGVDPKTGELIAVNVPDDKIGEKFYQNSK